MDFKHSPEQELKQKKSGGYFTSVFIYVIILLSLDQISKYFIVKNVPLHSSHTVIENFFHITHIRNTGIAFGLFSTNSSALKTTILCFSTVISLVLIIYLLIKMNSSSRIFTTSLSFIIAGALGNFIDRIFRSGEVVDFLDFHWYHLHWPSFNIADSSISVGVGLLILDTIINKDDNKNLKKIVADKSPDVNLV